jgi:DNA-binding Lrp family transcriptional regulator
MIDKVDSRLIGFLQRDARQTVKALAEQAGIAASTCLDRIRALQTSGVITGYHAHVDPAAFGRTLQAMVFVRLNPKTHDAVERFVEHLWALPETLEVTLLSGVDDVQVLLAVPDSEHLRRTVLSTIASYPGVADERTALVFEHRRKTEIGPLMPPVHAADQRLSSHRTPRNGR